MTLLTEIENFFKKEGTAAKNFLAPIEAELAPIAEADFKDIASAGIAAGVAAVTGGGSLTLTEIEATAVLVGRAIVSCAATKAVPLTQQAGLALAAAAGLSVSAPASATSTLTQ